MSLENGRFDDVTFWAMNIPKETDDFMKKIELSTTKGMTDTELKAYQLGVDNTVHIMRQLLDGNNADYESIVFYNPDVEITEEYSDEEIVEWLETRNNELL